MFIKLTIETENIVSIGEKLQTVSCWNILLCVSPGDSHTDELCAPEAKLLMEKAITLVFVGTISFPQHGESSTQSLIDIYRHGRPVRT